MQFDIITTQAQLSEYVKTLDNSPVSLDTEFVRTRTFYANLGLLQVSQNKKITLIDPIAIGNIDAFWQAIDNKHCILHASSEDLEIIKQQKGDLNITLFDTQVACAFLNQGASLGYAKMVESIEGVVLDKGESRTDWCARPLTAKQQVYAAADVLYLEPCLTVLQAQLEEKGMTDHFQEECQTILDQKMQAVDPEKAYKTLDNLFQLDRQSLAVIKALAKWRLKTAQARNLALNFVVKAEHLWLLAHYQPTSFNDLKRLKLAPSEIRIHGQQILNIIADVVQQDPETFPDLVTRLIDFPDYKKSLKAIRDKIKACAERHELPVELIASKRIINQYLSWCWKLTDEQRLTASKPKLLTGWRHQMIGHQLDYVISQ
ncbi:ribonuclease D [Psychromonas sp. B3M02]|uniref:ribonuclease D n=1 Tax=unclassified Psychromonas TaxID=2614957 RepID=UPI000DEB32F4|nr:ribonuclease D [Psychromonas sp. B3M02]RBW43789.1 ribonuclease D [Psychromonas sp. B3M02]